VTVYQWGHFVMRIMRNLNLISVQSWTYLREHYPCKQEEQCSISRYDMSLIRFPPSWNLANRQMWRSFHEQNWNRYFYRAVAHQDQDRTLKYQNALPYCVCCSTEGNKNSKVTVDSHVEAHWFNYWQVLGLKREVQKLKSRLSWNIVFSSPNALFPLSCLLLVNCF